MADHTGAEPAFKVAFRAWRGSLGQKEVAALFDVSISTIQAWESGRRQPGRWCMACVRRFMAEHSEAIQTAKRQ